MFAGVPVYYTINNVVKAVAFIKVHNSQLIFRFKYSAWRHMLLFYNYTRRLLQGAIVLAGVSIASRHEEIIYNEPII